MEQTLDLVAIGRASVDLYGEQVGGRLEDMASFAKYVGGSPTNTAIGTARLGLKSGLLTRVGADHMGRFIHEQLAREGVETHGVIRDPQRLTALVVLGIRNRESFPLIFYRENCADMALRADDLDEDWLRTAGAVLINGTHLSQSNVFETSLRAAHLMKDTGGRVVFDVDYRPVLWGLTERDMGENRFVPDAAVTRRLQEVLPLCDLIVGTEEEIHILGGNTNTVAALKAIRSLTDALLVCKRGPMGCVAFPADVPDDLDDGVRTPGFAVEVFNVLGAGDAFMAGFLSGWLRDLPLEHCCERANACGALVVSRHGCAPAMPTLEELETFLAMENRPFRVREHKELDHLHWATTRNERYDELAVLALDHRSQFEDLAKELGCSDERIGAFKGLALQALDRVAAGDRRFGLLMDGRYGSETLAKAGDYPYWLGRPIELPRSRPLEFEGSPDVATEIAQWPITQVVKCLVFYHPDDPSYLRAEQERQLLRLFDACRKTRHEFLLEVISPPHMPVDSSTIARAIEQLYEAGIRPDWWKLEPIRETSAWQKIESTIEANDPHCRGVLLLGLSAPMEDLIASFETAGQTRIIKGFAVGRTIFYDVAHAWLSGTADDEAAVEKMAARLTVLVGAWRRVRARMEEAA